MGELAVQVVGFVYIFLEVIVVVVLQLVAAHLQQVNDVFRYIGKLAFLDGVERFEVIVDMLQTRFAKAGNAIHQFAGKVVALILIESFFQYGIVVETAHGKCSGTLHLLDELFFEFY